MRLTNPAINQVALLTYPVLSKRGTDASERQRDVSVPLLATLAHATFLVAGIVSLKNVEVVFHHEAHEGTSENHTLESILSSLIQRPSLRLDINRIQSCRKNVSAEEPDTPISQKPIDHPVIKTIMAAPSLSFLSES